MVLLMYIVHCSVYKKKFNKLLNFFLKSVIPTPPHLADESLNGSLSDRSLIDCVFIELFYLV